jgi:hypothetical protein
MGGKMKFNLHNVTDGATKARVHYSLDNHVSRKPCVTLYEKDYDHKLRALFAETENDSESNTDYFEKDRVRFFEGHPHYAAARAAAVRAASK